MNVTCQYTPSLENGKRLDTYVGCEVIRPDIQVLPIGWCGSCLQKAAKSYKYNQKGCIEVCDSLMEAQSPGLPFRQTHRLQSGQESCASPGSYCKGGPVPKSSEQEAVCMYIPRRFTYIILVATAFGTPDNSLFATQ